MKLNKRVLLTAIIIAVLSILIIGCQVEDDEIVDETVDVDEGPRFGGDLRFAIHAEPPTLDSQYSTAMVTRMIMGQAMENLFRVDSEFEIRPMLADTYEWNEDGLTLTITIREGVKFHSGKIMTVDDVIASLKRYGTVDAFGRARMEVVDDYEVIDDHTFNIHLNKKSNLISTLAADPACIWPEEIVEQYGEEEISPESNIGTGPFKFVEWRRGDRIIFERFDDYLSLDEPASGMVGEKVAYVDTLTIFFVEESAAQLAGLQTGEFHFVDQVPYIDASTVEAHPDLELDIVMPAWATLGVINHKGGILANNRELRHAVLAAYDAEEAMLMSAEDERFYSVTPSLLWEHSVWGSNVGAEYYNQADPQKAAELAEAAGYAGEAIRLFVPTSPGHSTTIGIVLANQLTAAGFEVDMQVLEWGAMLDYLNTPENWEIYISGMEQWVEDPMRWNVVLHSQSGWRPGYGNQEMDELLVQFDASVDHAERFALWQEIQRIWWEDVAYLKLGDRYELRGYNASVLKGYEPFGLLRLWNVWLEE